MFLLRHRPSCNITARRSVIPTISYSWHHVVNHVDSSSNRMPAKQIAPSKEAMTAYCLTWPWHSRLLGVCPDQKGCSIRQLSTVTDQLDGVTATSLLVGTLCLTSTWEVLNSNRQQTQVHKLNERQQDITTDH